MKLLSFGNALSVFLAFIFVVCGRGVQAQSDIAKAVQLDSVTIDAVNRGFVVEDFIEMVRSDTSFYQAFKNLHFYPYTIKSKFTAFDKKGNVAAAQQRKAKQFVMDRNKWIVIDEEEVEGNFYKRKKKFRYYTAELLDIIFFDRDTVFASNKISVNFEEMETASNIDKLKLLMFNPGARIPGVPGAGNKLAIFDDEMVKYYNYSISSEVYRDSIPTYVFTCRMKDVRDFERGKIVIRELKTSFDKRNFRITSRNYDMGFHSIFFDFDVRIEVHHHFVNGQLVPSEFSYIGYWKIATKKAERAAFKVEFEDYFVN